jgi:hypothetical protein
MAIRPRSSVAGSAVIIADDPAAIIDGGFGRDHRWRVRP